jgi:hypothetical protein
MTKQRLGFLLTVTSILITGSAIAQSRICANKTTGNILIRSTCFSSENTITNIAGLRGPQGIQGVKGNTGSQGVQGVAGPQGPVVDVTKCRKVEKTETVISTGPKIPYWFSAMCNQGEFLFNHSGKSEAYFEDGTPISWGWGIAGTNMEYLNGANYPSGVSYQFNKEWGAGTTYNTTVVTTCCPLPQ